MSSRPLHLQRHIAVDGPSDRPLDRMDGIFGGLEQPSQKNRRILNSWKEIARYMGLGVRTVQRYERAYRLPVRRPAGKGRASVLALSDELDTWLTRIPTGSLGYVRPVLLIVDSHVAGTLPDRRAALENAHFNVLTSADVDEALATANKFDVDGFVFDCQDEEVCESLKNRFPNKPRFLMVPESCNIGDPSLGDYAIAAEDSHGLVNMVTAVMGAPRG